MLQTLSSLLAQKNRMFPGFEEKAMYLISEPNVTPQKLYILCVLKMILLPWGTDFKGLLKCKAGV